MTTSDKMKLCDQVAMYALGGLPDAEAETFERHLAQCADCRHELEELRRVTALLPLAAEPRPAPSGMRARALARAFASGAGAGGDAAPTGAASADASAPAEAGAPARSQDASALPAAEAPAAHVPASATPAPAEPPAPAAAPQRSRGALWRRGITAATAAAVILLAGYSSQLRHDLLQSRQEMAELQQRLSGAEQQLALAKQPSQGLKVNQVVTLSPAAQNIVAQGLATIVIDDKGTHLLVQAEKLPALKGTQAYQVWLLKDNTPYNAGTFVTAQGTGALYYTFEPRGYDTIAITLEPDAHGDKPRGQIVLAAPLKS